MPAKRQQDTASRQLNDRPGDASQGRRRQIPSSPARRALALVCLALLCASGCQSAPVRNTRKAASHTYRGARTVTRTTGKVINATGKAASVTAGLARKAWDEIPTWHEVRSGETFLKIAQFYGVPTDELSQLNPLIEPLKLEIGQRLRLRP